MAMEGLTEGRVVHFVMDVGRYKGEHRAADIVKVWDKETGMVNLAVKIDGENDLIGGSYPGLEAIHIMPMWVTSVPYSPTMEPRTWHWIEKS